MKSNKINSLLELNGKKSRDYSQCLGITRQSMARKKRLDSYSADDLIMLGEVTNTHLAYIDDNQKVIITFDINDVKKKHK